jgi:hypothetical protein
MARRSGFTKYQIRICGVRTSTMLMPLLGLLMENTSFQVEVAPVYSLPIMEASRCGMLLLVSEAGPIGVMIVDPTLQRLLGLLMENRLLQVRQTKQSRCGAQPMATRS